MSKQIARTILDQIKTLDFFALGAWGANGYLALENGVVFKCSGSKIKRGGKVRITLNGNDLYDIELFRIRGAKVTTLGTAKDIFCDDLVNQLDYLIG